MYSEAELKNFIKELSEGKHSLQNCERLAAVYIVMDHLNSDEDNAPGIANYGDTEFLQAIIDKDPGEVFYLLDELMQIILSINPKLYHGFMARLEGIK